MCRILDRAQMDLREHDYLIRTKARHGLPGYSTIVFKIDSGLQSNAGRGDAWGNRANLQQIIASIRVLRRLHV
jgi:hypothetical protein